MKKIILGLGLLVSSMFAGTINIAVAANVSYAIDDLKKEFKKVCPDTKVRVTLGSSGKLTAQINHGAPYDIFMAANMKYPEALYQEKKAVTKPVVYAQGALAYLTRKNVDFSKGINALKEKNIKKIAIANPKTAPYGKAALEAIEKSGIYESVKSKLVFAEAASQTVSYTMTVVDIGFVAKSSLYSSKMKNFKEGVNWENVDRSLYTPINQGIVILKKGENSQEVKNFYAFMLSPKAREILKKYGYLIP
jgi:molybdate transport system substrate-binding protein